MYSPDREHQSSFYLSTAAFNDVNQLVLKNNKAINEKIILPMTDAWPIPNDASMHFTWTYCSFICLFVCLIVYYSSMLFGLFGDNVNLTVVSGMTWTSSLKLTLNWHINYDDKLCMQYAKKKHHLSHNSGSYSILKFS